MLAAVKLSHKLGLNAESLYNQSLDARASFPHTRAGKWIWSTDDLSVDASKNRVFEWTPRGELRWMFLTPQSLLPGSAHGHDRLVLQRRSSSLHTGVWNFFYEDLEGHCLDRWMKSPLPPALTSYQDSQPHPHRRRAQLKADPGKNGKVILTPLRRERIMVLGLPPSVW
ncbi:hypothetical protein K438DRAFT_1782283 [Mycena galopus ATCC 62051]|nr:hypothetical protein K438DRAFT_1782283 [Mycena galopus ATCC 62051]